MKLAVGSTNPAKLAAVKNAFERLGLDVDVEGVRVESGVSDQPMTDEETANGAAQRASRAMALGNFDYGIGLEGGVMETDYGMYLCNWCAIHTRHGQTYLGGGVRVRLPEDIAQQVRQGVELGVVIDSVLGRHDVAKNEGTIGVLTQGKITRSQMFEDAIICAFAPCLNA